MSKQKEVFQLISQMVGNENIIATPKIFVNFTGDWNSAILLGQLLYWSDKGKNPNGWIYKTYADWEKEIGIKEGALRRAANRLKKLGVLKTDIKRANGSPTVHYRLNYEAFTESIISIAQNGYCHNDRNDPAEMTGTDTVEMTGTLTETSSENNPKTTAEDTEKQNSSTDNEKFNHYKYRYHNNNNKAKPSEEDQNVYRIYEANIGALTPIIANRLDMDVEDYSFEWVEKAIELAVTNEARNLVYVEAILARWKKDGFGVDKRQPKQTKRVQIDPYGNRGEL